MLLALVAVTGFCFTPAFAEMDNPMSSIESEDDFMVEEPGEDLENSDGAFGTNMQYTWIPINNFTPWRYTDTYNVSGIYRYFINAGYHYVGSGINLPSGAYLYGARAYFYDLSAGHVEVFIWRQTLPNTQTLLRSAVSSGTPGYGSLWLLLNHTIRNGDGQYVIYLGTSTGSANLRVGGVRLYWNRQISPAPASASFWDVPPSHTFFREIEALASSGITTGYADGSYRPNNPVTRQAMAAFLSRALGLHWAFPY